MIYDWTYKKKNIIYFFYETNSRWLNHLAEAWRLSLANFERAVFKKGERLCKEWEVWGGGSSLKLKKKRQTRFPIFWNFKIILNFKKKKEILELMLRKWKTRSLFKFVYFFLKFVIKYSLLDPPASVYTVQLGMDHN